MKKAIENVLSKSNKEVRRALHDKPTIDNPKAWHSVPQLSGEIHAKKTKPKKYMGF
jgi:hypothetical protein